MDTSEPTKRTRVRAYGQEFKARVVAECQQPGASVAKVALTHGLNANMLHTWRRELRGLSRVPQKAAANSFHCLWRAPPFLSRRHRSGIELRRGAISASIAWPLEAAGLAGLGCASC